MNAHQALVTGIGKSFHYMSGGGDTLHDSATNFVKALGYNIEISNQDRELLEKFSHGVIAHDHPNINFSDFVGTCSMMNADVLSRTQYISAHKNTKMYKAIFGEEEGKFYDLEGEKGFRGQKQVMKDIRDNIGTTLDNKNSIFMGIQDDITSAQKKIIRGLDDDIPVLKVTVEGLDGEWYPKLLTKLLANNSIKPLIEKTVRIKVEQMTAKEYRERLRIVPIPQGEKEIIIEE